MRPGNGKSYNPPYTNITLAGVNRLIFLQVIEIMINRWFELVPSIGELQRPRRWRVDDSIIEERKSHPFHRGTSSFWRYFWSFFFFIIIISSWASIRDKLTWKYAKRTRKAHRLLNLSSKRIRGGFERERVTPFDDKLNESGPKIIISGRGALTSN